MKKSKVSRLVKIYPKVRVLNRKLINRTYYETSQIKLEGNYLVNAGFIPNSKIEIEISEDTILIRRV